MLNNDSKRVEVERDAARADTDRPEGRLQRDRGQASKVKAAAKQRTPKPKVFKEEANRVGTREVRVGRQ